MELVRRPALIVVVAGLLALPACSLPRFFRHDPPAAPPPPESVRKASEFKPLSPGERISKSDVVVIAPKVSAHPAESSIPPPAPVPANAVPPHELPTNPLLDQGKRGPRPDSPLVAAVRAHLENQYASAVGHLGSFERPNQELLLLLLPILDSARSTDLTGRDPRAAALLAQQLESAAELVSKNAPLEIRTATFVSRVEQFGIYDPLPLGHRFLPGPGGIGLLYAEIDHVPVLPATQSNGERRYVTRLSGSIRLQDSMGRTVELYDKEKGKMVPELPFSQTDFTRSPVRDYFLKFEFPVPEKPGRYSLALDIGDPTSQGNRRTRKVVEFTVGP